jgi:predicted SprT family Zn-dependent metalloprotease
MELFEARKMADELMIKHGLIGNFKDWRFRFDNAKRRFGCCHYSTREITLSKSLVLLNSEANVRNTILHEIAHALTPGHGHDSVWRRKAMEIGCTGDRCYKSKDVVTPQSKYVAKCVGCGNTYKKHRRPKVSYSCTPCSGSRYNPKYKLEFVLNKLY